MVENNTSHQFPEMRRISTIHFVGIGGIGMSGLAQIMKNMGLNIKVSHKKRNKNTISCTT